MRGKKKSNFPEPEEEILNSFTIISDRNAVIRSIFPENKTSHFSLLLNKLYTNNLRNIITNYFSVELPAKTQAGAASGGGLQALLVEKFLCQRKLNKITWSNKVNEL